MSKNHINLDYIKEQQNSLYSGEKYLNYIEKHNIIINHFKSPEKTL